jgi:uncharacterized membrane protein YfcA
VTIALALRDLLAALGGFAVGLVSGTAGIGGGVLLVPLMVIGFAFSQHVAQGTSLAAVIPTAVVGAATHDRRGNVDRPAALWLGVSGAVGAAGGALLAVHLPREVLARLFALILLFAAWRIWRSRSETTG